MGEKNFKKHCPRCKKETPCKRRHVYALELENTVTEEAWFKTMNPNYQTGQPCVYVGKTIHHPLCRRSMHTNCRGEDWKDQSWTCYCHRKTGVNACNYGNRTARKRVSKYMTGYLKPKLYKKFNPQRGPTANSDAEYELAAHLRSLGMGVYTDATGEEE